MTKEDVLKSKLPRQFQYGWFGSNPLIEWDDAIEAMDKWADEKAVTIHHNGCTATMEACAKQWGMIGEDGKWKEEYLHLTFPPLPEINKIKKI